MLPWPDDVADAIDDNLQDILDLVGGTLWDAKQLEYLDKNFDAIDPTHAIVIDVDWYLERTQSDVGFHKDSRGTTLFVNLTYSNEREMQGASTKFDRVELRRLGRVVMDPDVVERHAGKRFDAGLEFAVVANFVYVPPRPTFLQR